MFEHSITFKTKYKTYEVVEEIDYQELKQIDIPIELMMNHTFVRHIEDIIETIGKDK